MWADEVERVTAAYRALEIDVYGGWKPEDVELLERWRTELPAEPEPGVFIDWLGARTAYSNYRDKKFPEGGWINDSLPIPGNGVFAAAIEYIGTLIAVERAMARSEAQGSSSFAAVELGAAYGPWTTTAGMLALRAGFQRIDLRAVEATASAEARILAHAELNGLTGRDEVVLRTFEAAVVATKRKPVFFPDIDNTADFGAAATTKRGGPDYRGQHLGQRRVPGVTIDDVFAGLDAVDLLHVDIQGGELELFQDRRFLRSIDAKAAVLVIGCHSREIEGTLMRELGSLGWELLRERPAGVNPKLVGTQPDPAAWLIRDGEQVWANPRFGG